MLHPARTLAHHTPVLVGTHGEMGVGLQCRQVEGSLPAAMKRQIKKKGADRLEATRHIF